MSTKKDRTRHRGKVGFWIRRDMERDADYRFLVNRLRRTGLDFVVVGEESFTILLKVEDVYTAIGIQDRVGEIPVICRVIPVDLVMTPTRWWWLRKLQEWRTKGATGQGVQSDPHCSLYYAETMLPAHNGCREVYGKRDRRFPSRI